MVSAPPFLEENYWLNLSIQDTDLEALSTYLLEVETPLTPQELLSRLVDERLMRERESAEKQQAYEAYVPELQYQVDQLLTFPALANISGKVISSRKAEILIGQKFDVIQVELDNGEQKEFASGLASHELNKPPEIVEEAPVSQSELIMQDHGNDLLVKLEAALQGNNDFVYIAGSWFPKALIVDVTEGQLNVAEALLDMAGGGPLSTIELLGDVDLPEGINPKLAAFSLDLALQEDERFDEVGPTGIVGWFLHRLEPEEVRETPIFLRHHENDYDRTLLTEEMIELERRLDDELSPHDPLDNSAIEQVEVRLIFPHWRAGTLPLTEKMARLFPTAYESPRVKFDFVDGDTGERFPGWVVRFERYIYGLRDWYSKSGLMPGAYLRARVGEQAGEIIVETEAHRASKEWVRTALVGSEGGVVYAMLKQTVETSFDERMMVFMPGEESAVDKAWQRSDDKQRDLARLVRKSVEELAKLNPQNHVHANEVYATVNVLKRCPPGPILAILTNGPEFEHVGDLHYRIAGTEAE